MEATTIDETGTPDAGGIRRFGHRGTAVVAAALVLVGSGCFLVGSVQRKAEAAVIGGNAPINASATNLVDLSAHNSPTVVLNPRRPAQIAVANRIDNPNYSCALHVSGDAGATWDAVEVPFPAGEELPARCYAPDLAFDGRGTLYMTFVTLKGQGNVPNAVWLVTSKDGGRRLSSPRKVLGPLAFQVRLAADPATPGRLHLSWLSATETGLYAFPQPGNPVMFRTSDDGGRTWKQARRVSPESRQRVVAPASAIAPDGDLYVVYLDLGDDRLDYHGAHGGRGGPPYAGTWQVVLARSGDGGRTWRETVVDDGVVPTERFVVFLPPSPSLAVDPGSGRVHIGFQDGRMGDADVLVWTSRDRGISFSAPVRVNDTPPRDGTTQHLPRLAVSPGGRLDVLYYDRRADRADVMSEVSLQSSFDGGRTFGTRLLLSGRAFSSRFGPGSDRGLPDLGSRLGLLSTERRALAVWADTRAGDVYLPKQDLSRAVATFTPESPWRTPLRVTGIAVAALGGAMLLGALLKGALVGRGDERLDSSPDPPLSAHR